MAARSEFLENVRNRTRPGRYAPTKAPDSVWNPNRERHAPEPIEDPPARFLEELRNLGGEGEIVGSPQEAREYVLSVARELDAKLVVRWADEDLEALDEPLAEAGVEVAVWQNQEDLRGSAARADVGLTTAEWAIAETGSLIFSGGPGRGRSVTLLPPVHVAVLPAERVLRTVPEAIGKYAGEELPANLAFHSGPSRSGDIEMQLTIGVHGPGDVRVVLVG